ncbi:hypothetical protein [Pectobacterium jejuense]|uniref:Uncharacterized protein n=1 Tax=Pectobacterium jejuense TaxID=2974022 RepID=A0ABW8GW73_9GAMM
MTDTTKWAADIQEKEGTERFSTLRKQRPAGWQTGMFFIKKRRERFSTLRKQRPAGWQTGMSAIKKSRNVFTLLDF